ncbi:MAG: hypothetical protein B7Y39_14265 [Bdellovibrio sp. 28-41-41]|nr:MAG: hypothetical protein B7Y39_14265 [Bdellovibrio sp. 28-41-41]
MLKLGVARQSGAMPSERFANTLYKVPLGLGSLKAVSASSPKYSPAGSGPFINKSTPTLMAST